MINISEIISILFLLTFSDASGIIQGKATLLDWNETGIWAAGPLKPVSNPRKLRRTFSSQPVATLR